MLVCSVLLWYELGDFHPMWETGSVLCNRCDFGLDFKQILGSLVLLRLCSSFLSFLNLVSFLLHVEQPIRGQLTILKVT